MKNTKKKDYTGVNVYIGIDVHKKSWETEFGLDSVNKKKVRFEKPFVENLVHYANRHYPNGTFICAYEAGFSGFWAKRQLEEFGFKVSIVNPADIPTSGKDKIFKSDKRDCRKIANVLRSGELEGIHCPTKLEEQDRAILRTRFQIAKVERQCKNRIKSLLLFMGIDIPTDLDKSYWSKRFINWLTDIATTHELKSLSHAIAMLNLVRKEHASILLSLRELSNTKRHVATCKLLQSAAGIGPLTSIQLKLELISMDRFSSTDKLISYIGFVPSTHHSGESTRVGKMVKRGRSQLRRSLVESAWVAIRYDEELREYYESCKLRTTANKAIVKVAVKMVRRLRYIWIHQVKWSSQKVNTSEIEKCEV